MSSQRELSSDVMAAFVHQVAIESLSEEQRRTMLSSLSEDLMLGKDVNLAKIAKQTAVRLTGPPSHLCIQIDHIMYNVIHIPDPIVNSLFDLSILFQVIHV